MAATSTLPRTKACTGCQSPRTARCRCAMPMRDAQSSTTESSAPGAAATPTAVTPRAVSAWEQTGPQSVIEQVFTVPSGAVYARKSEGLLFRTDDAGTTWVQVDAPTKSFGKGIGVDPTDPGTIYVSGIDGVYKTDNNAKTWKQVLPLKDEIHIIAVNPADRNVVYLSVGSGPSR